MSESGPFISVGDLRRKTADDQADLILGALAYATKGLLENGSDQKRRLAACTMTVFTKQPGEPISQALVEFERMIELKSKVSPHMTLYNALKQFVASRCNLVDDPNVVSLKTISRLN